MKSVLLTLVLLFTFASQAHDFHTPNYCNPQIKNFCAHLGYTSEPKINEAFEFVVDLVTTREMLATVQSVNVELFMPDMGHGTSPVQVKRLDQKHFQVSDAYFVMPGMWSVNIEVVTTEGPVTIAIPFNVK